MFGNAVKHIYIYNMHLFFRLLTLLSSLGICFVIFFFIFICTRSNQALLILCFPTSNTTLSSIVTCCILSLIQHRVSEMICNNHGDLRVPPNNTPTMPPPFQCHPSPKEIRRSFARDKKSHHFSHETTANLQALRLGQLRPTAVTCSALISACEGHWSTALGWLWQFYMEVIWKLLKDYPPWN